jgi:hypothetical protein
MSSLAKGPLIPPSTNFITNFTKLLKAENIQTDIITVPYPDGLNTVNLTLTEGILSNLKDPVLLQDAATRSYAELNAPGGAPGGSDKDVQFNNGITFSGSDNLEFDKGTTTLTTTAITDGTVTLGSGRISGLSNPLLPQDAATKDYVDNLFFISETTFTGTPVTYTGTSMVNGIITRDVLVGGSVVDTTATAEDIVAAVTDPVVGMTFELSVKNYTTTTPTEDSYTSRISIVGGTGVTIDFDVPSYIYKGYVLNAKIVLEDVSLGTEAVKITIVSNALISNDSYYYKLVQGASSVDTIRLTDYNSISINEKGVDGTVGTGSTTLIEITDIEDDKGVIGVGGPTVTFGTFVSFTIDITPFTGFWPQKIWETGSVEAYLVNNSGAPTTIVTGPEGWTMDPNSNMIIGIGQTAWILVYMNVDLYGPGTTGQIYVLGVFDTV